MVAHIASSAAALLAAVLCPVDARMMTLAGSFTDAAQAFREVVKTDTGILVQSEKTLTHLAVAANPSPGSPGSTFTKQGVFVAPNAIKDFTYDPATKLSYMLYPNGVVTCRNWANPAAPAACSWATEQLYAALADTCTKIRLSTISARKFLIFACEQNFQIMELKAPTNAILGQGSFAGASANKCDHLEVGNVDAATATWWLGCGGDLVYVLVTEATLLTAGFLTAYKPRGYGVNPVVYDLFVSGDKVVVALLPNTATATTFERITGTASGYTDGPVSDGPIQTVGPVSFMQDATAPNDMYIIGSTPAKPAAAALLGTVAGTTPTYYTSPATLPKPPSYGTMTYVNFLFVCLEGEVTLYLLGPVKCSTHTCTTAGATAKPMPDSITCVGTPPVCDDATCCNIPLKCGDGAGHMCSAGFQDKANKAMISCVGTPAACNDATCCDAEVKCGDGGGHMCSMGFQDKAGKATIVCAGMPPACNDATCCDAQVKCGDGAGHTCSMGFQDKAGKAMIVCVGMPPVCNDATCCDAQVKCGDGAGHMCSAGFQDKAGKAMIVCVGMPPVCNDATCCDAQVKCGDGAGHMCSMGFQDKAGKATIVCVGMPPVCNDATCCDVTCAHTGFTCTAPAVKAGGAATCGALVTDCTVATCCEVNCNAYSCPAGFVAKTPEPTCGSAVADCTTAICCDATCDNAGFTCPEGVLKGSPATMRCGSTVADCTGTACCVVYCASFTCSTGMIKVGAAATTACGSTAASCTDALCCDATCAVPAFTCSVGAKKADAATTVCGRRAADCDDGKCCEPSCTGFVCGAGFQDKASMGMPIVCTMMAACTEAVCCDATCSNAGYTTPCDANWQPKAAAATVLCGATPADCTPAKCCEPLCTLQPCLASGGLQHKGSAAGIVCGAAAVDCTDALCCDVTCGHATVACGTSRSLKAMPTSITCGPLPGDCTTDKCCEQTCENFACPAGFTDKAGKSSVVCGALSTDCSSAKCCSFNCAHTGFVCSAGALRKANAASVLCGTGATLAECTDAACCDATCESHMCQTGFASRGRVRCTAGCDDVLCCEYTCGHASVTCGATATKRDNASLIRCGVLNNCTPATCCDVTCEAYTCGAGLKAKATPALVCGPALSDCTAAKCCDVTCDNAAFACGAGAKKTGGDQLLCGAAVDDCTDALCCEVSCTSYTCGSGFTSKANPAGIVCGASAASCTDAVCCDATCAHTGVACGTSKLKANSATIVCGSSVADCTVATCCDATCKDFVCPTPGYVEKSNPDSILCGAACTSGLCCDVTCEVHACTSGQQKANPSGIACTAAACSDTECCEPFVCDAFTCGTGFVDATNKATAVCGGSPTDCTDTCCDATCASYTCAGRVKQPTTLCGALASDCTDEQCCELLCTSHTCGVGFVGKALVEACPARGCSDEACCDTTCAHADFACKDGTAKQGVDGITCGAAAGSCTQSLCCDAPVRSARDTPASGLSVKAKKRLTVSADVAGVASVGTANGGKLLVLKHFNCLVQEIDLGEEKPLDWQFHPTRVAIGSALEKYFFGALVFNPLLVVGFALIACAVAYAMKLLMGSPTPRAFGDARTPGVVYLMHIFLLQGTSLVAAQVCFAPGKHSSGVIVLSWFVLAACVASPAVVYFGVLRRVPVHSEVVGDPAIYGEGEGEEGKSGKRANARWYKFLFGTEVWVSKQGYFAEQYGMVYESLRAGCLWYITAESAVILSLSLMSAFKPASLTTCDFRNFSIAVILVAFFLACLLKRPFIAPVDNCIAIALSFFMAAAVVAMSLALATESSKDSWLYFVSEWALFVAALVMTAKALWDLVQYMADVAVSRRSTARELARQRQDAYPDDTYELLEKDADSGRLLVPLPQNRNQTAVGAARKDSFTAVPLATPASRTSCPDVWSSLTDATLTGHGVVVTASAPQPYLALDTDPLGASRSSSRKKQRALSRTLVWV